MMPIRELIGHKDGAYATISQIGELSFPSSPALLNSASVRLTDIETFQMLFTYTSDPSPEVIDIKNISDDSTIVSKLLTLFGDTKCIKFNSSSTLIPTYQPFINTSLVLYGFSPNGTKMLIKDYTAQNAANNATNLIYYNDISYVGTSDLLTDNILPSFGGVLPVFPKINISEDTIFIMAQYTSPQSENYMILRNALSDRELLLFKQKLPIGTFDVTLNLKTADPSLTQSDLVHVAYSTEAWSSPSVYEATADSTTGEIFNDTKLLFKTFRPTMIAVYSGLYDFIPKDLTLSSTPISDPPFGEPGLINLSGSTTSTTVTGIIEDISPHPYHTRNLTIDVTIATNGGSADVYINSDKVVSTTASGTFTIPDLDHVQSISCLATGDGTNATTVSITGFKITQNIFTTWK